MFLIIWMSPVSMETNLVQTKPSGPTAFPVASPERWGSGSSAGDRKRYGRRFWWTGSVLMEWPGSDGLILIQNRNRNSPAAPSRPAAAGSGPRSCCPQTGPWRGRVCCRSAAERERGRKADFLLQQEVRTFIVMALPHPLPRVLQVGPKDPADLGFAGLWDLGDHSLWSRFSLLLRVSLRKEEIKTTI